MKQYKMKEKEDKLLRSIYTMINRSKIRTVIKKKDRMALTMATRMIPNNRQSRTKRREQKGLK